MFGEYGEDDEDYVYGLTDEGRLKVIGILSGFCHGFDIQQVADLNGLSGPDDVRAPLTILVTQVGLLQADDFPDMEE